MTPAALILLALKASICLLVFSFGLRAEVADVTSLARRPRELLRSLLAMYGVMPLAAVGMAKAFDLPPATSRRPWRSPSSRSPCRRCPRSCRGSS
jgi:bile acid:Na+ symporter, BASS family